jgi:ribA/ribD-fused uncharacterized protein
MADELKTFYKAKAKKPQSFSYDVDGNLVELNKDGEVIKTITLPSYRPPTYEEIDEMEKKRNELIALATKEYDQAITTLRDAYDKPNTSSSEIVRLNRVVENADIKLQSVRFPLRYVEKVDNIEIREIDFSQPNEVRKFPYAISFLRASPFTLQDQYSRIGQVAPKPLISVAEAKELENNNIPVILFWEPDTNDYGFLSLKWTVELEINNTIYNSAQQALYAEIAKAFNDQENLKKIMIAETPDSIQYSVNDVPGEDNEAKWNDLTNRLIYDINIAKFKRYPELGARLLETKNAVLGAYEPNDNLIGIGISLDDIRSKNPVNWTGQNLLGKALMDIRNQIRSDRGIPEVITRVPKPRRKKVEKPAEQLLSTITDAVQPVTETLTSIVQPVTNAIQSLVQPVTQTGPTSVQPVTQSGPTSVQPVTQTGPTSVPRPIRRRPVPSSGV